MPVPSSGSLSLGKIGKEIRSTSISDDYDNGPHTSSETSLDTAENGGYGNINQNNTSTNRPSATNPAQMSEWYSYDHNLS